MKTTLLAILLITPAAFAADLTGRFDRGTAYEPPAAHAPANVSRMFSKSFTRTARTTTVELPAAGGSGMIVWTIGARPVRSRLITPHGATLEPGDRGSLERGLRRFDIPAPETAELDLPRGAHEVVHVLRTSPATYRLELDLPADVAGVTVVAAEPESPITLSSWASPLSRQPGEPVTLHVALRDGAVAIPGAVVTARLASPNGKAFDSIPLVDQGDGTYRATIADLPAATAGAWQVRFEAEGLTGNGIAFARTGSGEFVAERGAARLDPRSIRAEVAGDLVRITASADVRIAGAYRFDVIVAGPTVADSVRPSLAWAEGMRQLQPGPATLTLDIPLAHLGETKLEDLFLDVRLLGLDPFGVAGQAAVEVN